MTQECSNIPGQELNTEQQHLLELAKTSPSFALNHDKQNWLNLFSKDGSVIDPVGTPIHDSSEKISSFYDTFIKPNKIVFKEYHNWVDLARRKVYRDIDIYITFPNGGVQVQPVHLKYVFDENEKILQLRAYWSFLDGYPGVENGIFDYVRYSLAATNAFYGIFSNLGMSFGTSYLKSMSLAPLSNGKKLIRNFISFVNQNRDVSDKPLLDIFESEQVPVELPKDVDVVARELFGIMRDELKVSEMKSTKVFNSGGYFSTVKFVIKVQGEDRVGLGIFELNKEGDKISRVELVW